MAEKNDSLKSLLALVERAADRLERGLAEQPYFERARSLAQSEHIPVAWLVLPLDKDSLFAALKWLVKDPESLYADIGQSGEPVTRIEVLSAKECGAETSAVVARGAFGPCTLLLVRDCAAVSESGRVLNRAMELAPAWLVAGRPESVASDDFAIAKKMLAGAVCTPMAAIVLGDGEAAWPKAIEAQVTIQVATADGGYQEPSGKNLLKQSDIRSLKQRYLLRQLIRVMGSELTCRRESNVMRIMDSQREKADYDQALKQCDGEKKDYAEQAAKQMGALKATALETLGAGLRPEFASLIKHGLKGIAALRETGYPFKDEILAMPPADAIKQTSDLLHSWLEMQLKEDESWMMQSCNQLQAVAGGVLAGAPVRVCDPADEAKRFAQEFFGENFFGETLNPLKKEIEKSIPNIWKETKSYLGTITTFCLVSSSLTAWQWDEKGMFANAMKFLGVAATVIGIAISIWLFRKERITAVNKRKSEIIEALAKFARQVRSRREELAGKKLNKLEDEVKKKIGTIADELISRKRSELQHLIEEAVIRGKAADADKEMLKDVEDILNEASKLANG